MEMLGNSGHPLIGVDRRKCWENTPQEKVGVSDRAFRIVLVLVLDKILD